MRIGIEYWLILLIFRAPHYCFTTEERRNYSDLGEFEGKLSITDHRPHIFSIIFYIPLSRAAHRHGYSFFTAIRALTFLTTYTIYTTFHPNSLFRP
jgi:hypothetical protein